MNEQLKNLMPLLKIVGSLVILFILFNIHYLLALTVVAAFIVYIFVKNRANYLTYKGNRLYEQGSKDEALEWFKKAAQYQFSKPHHGTVYGYMLLRVGRLDEAEAVFQSVLSKNLDRTDKRDAYLNMGLVRWKQGRIQDAIEIVENVFEDYRNTVVYGTLGYLYIEAREYDRALEFNLEAHDYNETDPVIWDNLGQTYYMRREYDQAEQHYVELIELKPKFPEPYYHYAMVRYSQGDASQAVELLKQALEQRTTYLSTVSLEEVELQLEKVESEAPVLD